MSIAIYARQSVDKKDSISIESQIDSCKREVIDGEIKIYIDKGFSGKNTDRPKFKEMEKDIKEGLITKVIVYKLDRISRNLLDFSNIIEYYKKYEVGFLSCNEKFDTSTPMGNAMLSICMVFAQLERETIQKRVRDNYYARGAKGLYMGGRAPYGYIKIETKVNGKKTYTFENDNTKLISLLEMYELYSSTDMSLGKVSDHLNTEGILAAEGGAWDSCKISRILRSPAYVMGDADVYSYYKNKGCNIVNDVTEFVGINGLYLYGKRESNERKYTKVTDHTLSIALHEGVVDSSTWLACQYKLDANKQIKNAGKGKHSWLSGLIKCGTCGYTVTVVVSRDKRYLSCRGKSNLKICDGFKTTMYAENIEKIVKEDIFEIVEKIRNDDFPKQEIEDSQTNKSKIQIIEIDRQIENLISQLAEASKITTKYVNEKIEKLDTEKNTLISEISKVVVNKHRTHSKEDLLKSVDAWETLSMEEKKKIAYFFIEKVRVTDTRVIIDWNEISF